MERARRVDVFVVGSFNHRVTVAEVPSPPIVTIGHQTLFSARSVGLLIPVDIHLVFLIRLVDVDARNINDIAVRFLSTSTRPTSDRSLGPNCRVSDAGCRSDAFPVGLR